jgi:hypothetical protein
VLLHPGLSYFAPSVLRHSLRQKCGFAFTCAPHPVLMRRRPHRRIRGHNICRGFEGSPLFRTFGAPALIAAKMRGSHSRAFRIRCLCAGVRIAAFAATVFAGASRGFSIPSAESAQRPEPPWALLFRTFGAPALIAAKMRVRIHARSASGAYAPASASPHSLPQYLPGLPEGSPSPALKARHRIAQGGGRAAPGTLGCMEPGCQPCRGGIGFSAYFPPFGPLASLER